MQPTTPTDSRTMSELPTCSSHWVSSATAGIEEKSIAGRPAWIIARGRHAAQPRRDDPGRSEEHTSELQSQSKLVCRLLLEKKKKKKKIQKKKKTETSRKDNGKI